MRKVGEYLGLVEQAEFDDEFDDDFDQPAPVSRQAVAVRPAPVASIVRRIESIVGAPR
jgi:cell division inhibitor SepF